MKQKCINAANEAKKYLNVVVNNDFLIDCYNTMVGGEIENYSFCATIQKRWPKSNLDEGFFFKVLEMFPIYNGEQYLKISTSEPLAFSNNDEGGFIKYHAFATASRTYYFDMFSHSPSGVVEVIKDAKWEIVNKMI